MKRIWIKYGYISLLIISGILFFTYNIENQNSKMPQFFKEQVEKEYIGIVTKKYVDIENHNNKILILRSLGVDKKTLWSADRSGFFEFISKGDSIVKHSGSEMIKVYRRDSLLQSFRMNWNIN